MRIYTFFFTIILLINCVLSSAQVSSGKKSFKFNSTPELVIENLKFVDGNNDNQAETGESCFLVFNLKNQGNSDAKSVNILVNVATNNQNLFTYEKSIPIGNIESDESREIKIPISPTANLEDAIVGFQVSATEVNNYDSKPVQIDVNLKAVNSSIAIGWLSPSTIETRTDADSVTIKACISSILPVTTLELFVNNKLYPSNRGFTTTKASICNNYMEQKIKLEKGNNQIQIVAQNKKMKAESEIRNIVYADAEFEYRTALVIGNSKYQDSPLSNPGNDAAAMAKTLRELNFDVIEVIDGNKKMMDASSELFFEKLEQKKGIGLVFYAGHGIEVDGMNYLIPVNHKIEKSIDVPYEAISVSRLLDNMQISGTRMNILILDACRNNPLPRSSRSGTRGLAEIPAKGSGSIIAYATAPGEVASDGAGENGLFTQELLKAIKTPGLEVGMVFRTVMANVKKLSDGKQLPWTNVSVEGEFYFTK